MLTQKTAWFLPQRIREALKGEFASLSEDSVEADETYFDSLEKSTHK